MLTPRPVSAYDAAALPRPAARVAKVAGILDCHPTEVRRLVGKGELEAHGTGARGVRIFLDSVRNYQDRQAKASSPRPSEPIHKRKKPAAASSAALRHALAGLAAKGLI